MAIDDDPVVAGEAIAAAAMQARLDALVNGINGELSDYALRKAALRREHFTDGLVGLGRISSEMTAVLEVPDSYINVYPGYADSTYLGEGGGLAGVGWMGLASSLIIDVDGGVIPIDQDESDVRIGGILCLANLQLLSIRDTGGQYYPTWKAMFTWMVNVSSGVPEWHNLAHTEKAVYQRLEMGQAIGVTALYQRTDVSLRTLITRKALDAWSIPNGVHSVQVAVAFTEGGGIPVIGDGFVFIDKFQVTAIPLRAQEAP